MKAIRPGLSLCALILVSPTALSQTVTELTMDDVYFQFRPARPGVSLACGFAILGNHLSRKEPRVEWDLNIDMVINGADRIAGVAAGTFDVVNKPRVPRQPP